MFQGDDLGEFSQEDMANGKWKKYVIEVINNTNSELPAGFKFFF